MEPLTFEELSALVSKAIENFALDDFMDISDDSVKRLSVSIVKTMAMAGALEEGSTILRNLKERPIEYIDTDDEDEEVFIDEEWENDLDPEE